MLDLAIAGAGIAGLAAAIRAGEAGLRTVLVGRSAPGGMVRDAVRIEAAPGFPVGLSGLELISRMERQAARYGVSVRTDTATGLQGGQLVMSDGSLLFARAVLIATGASRDPLPASFAHFVGSGVYAGAPSTLPSGLRGRDIFFSGDVTHARAAAGSVARKARSVHVVPEHLEMVEMLGADRLEAIAFRDRRNGRMSVRNAAALYVIRPSVPNTSWLPDSVELHDDGTVCTGAYGSAYSTNLRGVFAAGAVTGARLDSIEKVIEEGMSAVRSIMEMKS